jgi:hypothetical protein
MPPPKRGRGDPLGGVDRVRERSNLFERETDRGKMKSPKEKSVRKRGFSSEREEREGDVVLWVCRQGKERKWRGGDRSREERKRERERERKM